MWLHFGTVLLNTYGYVYELFKNKTMLKGGDPVDYALAKAKLNSLYGMCVQKAIQQDIVEDYDIWSIKDGVKLRISLLNHKDYVVAEFGKTIFLTREEAEKEMEGGADV